MKRLTRMRASSEENDQAINEQLFDQHSLSDWDLAKLKNEFKNAEDFEFVTVNYRDDLVVTFIYSDVMVDLKQLNEYVLPQAAEMNNHDADVSFVFLHKLAFHSIETDRGLFERLLSGDLVIFIEHESEKSLLYRKMSDIAKRETEESATEISIKGPRDGFTEELDTNISLLRKRLKTPLLKNREFLLGEKSQTTIALVYLEKTISTELIEIVIERLNSCKIDYLESSQQLEEYLGNNRLSLFPLVNYCGRADFLAQSLRRGRFGIIIDGSPMALIAPSNLTEQIKSPEDFYHPFYFVALERLLRLFAFIVAIFLPGFYIALASYNVEQIPLYLLATITNSRFGIPFSGPMEAFLMIWMFEIFREAGVRLPKSVGQTIAVIGGLIVGDAAIRAGLTSPTLLVVMAVAAVAQFTLINQSLLGSVTIFRLFVLSGASLLGMYGFFLSLFFIVVYAAGLTSFGVGYLEPIAPVSFKEWIAAILDRPKSSHVALPKMLKK
ncbi:spore germination protein [Alkalihalobacillus pseudalcaliphilus]|uniref:spore germination protein n=1 Tax=Alkalihalobacillus pseudalcaliphilus TaxID=79884 RepID=UPI00064D72EF|nr:spore germination protein [Alkalihalobacillus pseudalcaliphilus]KMK76164.1 spore gernimation protein GerA [Alkalihalobacillus pseudalcaliphilus]